MIESSQEDQIPAKDYAGELGWNTDFDLDSLDKSPRMRVLAYQDDLDRTAKKITTTARTSIEESGANMLYLCFGFLEWKDSETVQASNAPLLIMPVTIDREKAPRNLGWVYNIQYSSEDLTTNLSLVEKMKRDFAVAVPYLREQDTPSSYADAVREAVSDRPEWQVRNFLTLSLLSFGKLLMFSVKTHPTLKIPRCRSLCSSAIRLQPSEALFDTLPLPLTDGISRVPRGTRINRTPTWPFQILRHVRRDLHVSALRHEICRVIGLVAAHGHLPCSRNLFQHDQRGIALRRSVGLEHLGVYDQTVAVLHQQIPVVTQLGFFALAFACHLRIWVGLRLVGLVRPLLAVEVYRRVARIVRRNRVH